MIAVRLHVPAANHLPASGLYVATDPAKEIRVESLDDFVYPDIASREDEIIVPIQ